MIRAVWNGAVLAEAATTVQLEGNDYFPAESLRHEFPKESATTTVCPWMNAMPFETRPAAKTMISAPVTWKKRRMSKR